MMINAELFATAPSHIDVDKREEPQGSEEIFSFTIKKKIGQKQ